MKVIINLLLAVLIAIQSGCVSVLVGTAITTATVVGMQDKSLGTTIDDTTIMIRMNKEFLNYSLFSSVKVKVDEGIVLLMGNVDSIEKQITAERIAWEQKGVKQVINKINVKTSDNTSITNYAKDSLITARIKAKILRKRNVKSVNYSVNTVDGIVYLMGIAQNSKELNEVIKAIKKIKDVKEVISYVRFIDKQG